MTDNVIVRYIIRHLNGDKKTTEDMFIGTIRFENQEGITHNHFFAKNDTLVSKTESVLEEKTTISKLEIDAQTEEFPIDENYYPGKLLEQIKPAAWYSGCLPGGYMWCGEGCGGYPACRNSTNPGSNSLDTCCKQHDCCYGTRGVKWKNCYCDSILCQCALDVGNRPIATPVVLAAMCFSC